MLDRRLLVALLAIAAIAVTACEPMKKKTPPAPPSAGAFIAYYMSTTDGSAGFRSMEPHSWPIPGGGTSSQMLSASDGSVALNISNTNNQPTHNGFQTVPLRLGDIETLQLELAAGSDVALALFLDKGGDGDFFSWDAGGNLIGNASDLFAVDGNTGGGSAISVSGTTSFLICPGPGETCPGLSRTLQQLKAGMEPGVDANTRAAIFVYVFIPDSTPLPTSRAATVTSLVLNGTELLVP